MILRLSEEGKKFINFLLSHDTLFPIPPSLSSLSFSPHLVSRIVFHLAHNSGSLSHYPNHDHRFARSLTNSFIIRTIIGWWVRGRWFLLFALNFFLGLLTRNWFLRSWNFGLEDRRWRCRLYQRRSITSTRNRSRATLLSIMSEFFIFGKPIGRSFFIWFSLLTQQSFLH